MEFSSAGEQGCQDANQPDEPRGSPPHFALCREWIHGKGRMGESQSRMGHGQGSMERKYPYQSHPGNLKSRGEDAHKTAPGKRQNTVMIKLHTYTCAKFRQNMSPNVKIVQFFCG